MTDLQREVRNVRRLGRLLAVLTMLLLVVLSLYAWPIVRNYFFPVEGSRPITPRGNLFSFENVTIDVAKKASPSVAFVTTERHVVNPSNRQVQEIPQGSGSGFIWDEAGHVVTNYHVLHDAVQQNLTISVILSDQTSYEATFVGASPAHDLAVLKISAPLGVRLVPIPIGKSGDLQVGQSVFAIGNPFGLDQTVTTGIISALKRVIGPTENPIEDAIQTDAAINPGNSGGPLLDSAGRLIGINTAIIKSSQSGGWSGIGFAIPVDTANRVVPQIIATGKYQRAKLGANFYDPLQRLLPEGVRGLPIAGVESGSPADKAGLIPATFQAPATSRGRFRGPGFRPTLGDVITAINDKPIKSTDDLFTIMDHITPGDTVDLTLWRNGEIRHVKVTTTQ